MAHVDRHFEKLDPTALSPASTLWERGRMICMALLVLGLVGVAVAWPMNPTQFYHSLLSSWSTCWTAMMGVLFFVMLHYLVDAGWSTVVRRPAEQMLAAMPVILLAAIPIVIGMYGGKLQHWIDADPAADHLLSKKTWYLDKTFLAIRLVFYAAVWLFVAYRFRRNSLAQDRDGAGAWTISSQRWSAGGMVLYAIAVTFCAIDLLMALDHHWFSTVFGVYVWTGGVVAGLCVITLVSLKLRSGPLRQYIGSDQVHDLGKLIFAFSVFWAYIGFSQYFLVWYGNIPEETIWYLRRWTGTEDQGSWWWLVSILMPIGRFLVPFLVLMSATAKRNERVLGTMCAVLLLFHWMDQYWMVMPELAPARPPVEYLWMDLAALAAIVGACGMVFISVLRKAALFPVMDPRLVEALSAEHVEEIECADTDS